MYLRAIIIKESRYVVYWSQWIRSVQHNFIRDTLLGKSVSLLLFLASAGRMWTSLQWKSVRNCSGDAEMPYPMHSNAKKLNLASSTVNNRLLQCLSLAKCPSSLLHYIAEWVMVGWQLWIFLGGLKLNLPLIASCGSFRRERVVHQFSSSQPCSTFKQDCLHDNEQNTPTFYVCPYSGYPAILENHDLILDITNFANFEYGLATDVWIL